MDTQKNNGQQSSNEGTGRTHNSQTETQQASEQSAGADISAIDQQEGSMNNGTVGDVADGHSETLKHKQ